MTLMRSLRYAVRSLLRARGFTTAAILTLTLGIAATTTVFTVVNAVLLRPLPYPAPERLVSVSHILVVGGMLRVEQSDATALFYRRHNRAFAAFGAYQTGAASLGPVSGVDAERLAAARINADVFPALGVAPIRGRVFSDADDQPGAPPVVIVAEQLWRRKFGADPGILNRTLDVDGMPHEVIGIMPSAVRFPASDTALWLPLRLDPKKTESATFDYQAIARLRDGVSIDAATDDLQPLLLHVSDEFPGRMTRASIEQTRMHVSVRPLGSVVVGDIGRLLWPVLASALLVLAIACANVGNLFLVRAEVRRSSVAVQRALGAGAGTILVEFLSEGLVVAIVSGGLGLAVAAAAVPMVRQLGTTIDVPRLTEVGLDLRVFAVAALLVVLAALFVSVLPALRSAAASAASLLSATTRSATAGRARVRVRHALVVSQVALALVLLAGSGLMARSVWRLRSVQPGFDPSNALTFRIALPAATYPDADSAVRFFARAAEAVETAPGVRAVGVVSKLPLEDRSRIDTAVFVEDRPIPPGSLPGIHTIAYATAGYFRAAGIPILAGRTFSRPDPPHVQLEAIVSRAFARRYWNDESPIGKRIRILLRGPWYTIVGVAGSIRDTALDQPEDQMIYCPLLPAREDPRWTPRELAFVARTMRDPQSAVGAVRDVVHTLDRSLPTYRLQPLTALLTHSAGRRSLALLLIGCASVVALLLGAIGLYGVMSYVVTLRTQELGIRLALGARPVDVRRMVSRQGLIVATCGTAIGLAGAVAATRLLSTLLYDVKPTDPLVLGGSAALLMTVAVAATWLPARRAAAVDPARALRAE